VAVVAEAASSRPAMQALEKVARGKRIIVSPWNGSETATVKGARRGRLAADSQTIDMPLRA
jgi:hypothetical protein